MMSRKERLLSLAEAQHRLRYDPDSGIFVWQNSVMKAFNGCVAGYLGHAGYIRIELRGEWYAAHRLAWFITNGAWPSGQIDHINGCRTDKQDRKSAMR